MATLWTIGHSNHSLTTFLALLSQHEIGAIADVRSMPYSRYVPHFNPAALKVSLESAGISYVYLGKELGARPDDPACYVDGRVSYERLARRPAFQTGLSRVQQGLTRFRLALMCTEKDPLDCHRMVLICRELRPTGDELLHIRDDGQIETNDEAERRLCERLDLRPNLFEGWSEVIERAYELQSRRLAFQRPAGRADDEAEADR